MTGSRFGFWSGVGIWVWILASFVKSFVGWEFLGLEVGAGKQVFSPRALLRLRLGEC